VYEALSYLLGKRDVALSLEPLDALGIELRRTLFIFLR
jgi:hypothetical protein